MARFGENHTIVLAGIGFDAAGPYLSFNDLEAGSQTQFSVQGKTFSLRLLAQRRCVGSIDLATHQGQVCPQAATLLPEAKDNSCPACQKETGFNPAFYNAASLSAQQRAYNLTPHYVYMAYFSPQYVKVGISSETRGIKRLLDQGARAALVVGRFESAEEARVLEARLCAQPGIYETMRAAKKVELFTEERYDFAEAQVILQAKAEGLGLNPDEACLDLTPYYFAGAQPTSDEVQLPGDEFEGLCGGRCIGMIGSVLVFEQSAVYFAVPLKGWESHEVELFLDEVIPSYSFEPLQMSLL
ncbi:MAG: DUF2797 domain-containing protein [Raoultibacter sp.]